MKTVTTVKNQTIFDLAAEYYGNTALFDKIMELNPSLKNDYEVARDKGIPFDESVFDLSFPLLDNQMVQIDTMLENRQVLRELKSSGIFSFTNNDI